MNPRKLFTLTAEEKSAYQIQPDHYPKYDWAASTEEYEIPPFIPQTFMRFWYNTEDTSYYTHWHDAQEIIVPLEENYTVTVQDTLFHLVPGDILLIPPGSLHSLEAPGSGARFIFLLEHNILCQLTDFFRTQALLSKPVYITSDTCPEIYEQEIGLIMQAASHYWGNAPSRQLRIYSCLMEFYACYTDFCIAPNNSAADNSGNLLSSDCSRKISALLNYLQTHYTDNISLEEAAAKAGLSKFYFARVFKRHTGHTFYDYLSFLRIQSAEQLLKDTATPVSKIATATGYATLSSFNRSFQKFQKCTPSEYRNLYGHGM